MNATILILGAGVMQLPSIRAARRLGLHIIVADGNDHAIGIPEADEFLAIDLKNHEEMAGAAAAIRERRGLDAVFTAGTDFSATVAYVAEHLGLPGTPYEAALDATDKFRMRGVLRDAGVRVPEFTVLTREELEEGGCATAQRSVTLPVVVKPVDSMGARGVVRADKWSDAERFAYEAVEFSRSGRVVIEGYIDGPEFSLDAIVGVEDTQVAGFADRHICFPPYFIEMGHTIPTSLSSTDQLAVVTEFTRAIRALGLGPGAAKGDIKLSHRGAVVGEVANRLSGGYMSGWTFPLSSGVPLSEIGIRVALGHVPPRIVPRWEKTTAERAVISIPGMLREIQGAEEARSLPGVEELFITRSAGDTLVFPRNNVEKAGNVIATAEERASATDAAERAVAAIIVRLQPAQKQTDRFLFGVPTAERPLPPEYANSAFSGRFTEGDMLELWNRRLAHGGLESAQRPEYRFPASLLVAERTDWAFRSLELSLERLADCSDCRITATDSPSTIDSGSRLLVRAMLKGGLQGALYAIDTLSQSGYTP